MKIPEERGRFWKLKKKDENPYLTASPSGFFRLVKASQDRFQNFMT
jgi:hypothetical protein